MNNKLMDNFSKEYFNNIHRKDNIFNETKNELNEKYKSSEYMFFNYKKRPFSKSLIKTFESDMYHMSSNLYDEKLFKSNHLILNPARWTNLGMNLNIIPNNIEILELNNEICLDYLEGEMQENLECLIIPLKKDQIFRKGFLKCNVKYLLLRGNLNMELEEGYFPEGLEYLKFNYSYNSKLVKNIFPNTLIYLNLGDEFNQIIEPGTLPDSLAWLCFENKYNQTLIPGSLPRNLKKLNFGEQYNQIIERNVLPEGLIHLDLGASFNQIIDIGVLPSTLKILKFSYFFNKKIEKRVLPDNLLVLWFSSGFNKPLERDVLPRKLKVLYFSNFSQYNHPLTEGILPDGLEYLELGTYFFADEVLPINLKCLIRNNLHCDVGKDLKRLKNLKYYLIKNLDVIGNVDVKFSYKKMENGKISLKNEKIKNEIYEKFTVYLIRLSSIISPKKEKNLKMMSRYSWKTMTKIMISNLNNI